MFCFRLAENLRNSQITLFSRSSAASQLSTMPLHALCAPLCQKRSHNGVKSILSMVVTSYGPQHLADNMQTHAMHPLYGYACSLHIQFDYSSHLAVSMNVSWTRTQHSVTDQLSSNSRLFMASFSMFLLFRCRPQMPYSAAAGNLIILNGEIYLYISVYLCRALASLKKRICSLY